MFDSETKSGKDKSPEQTLETFGRTVPHAADAESTILGAILLDNDILNDIASKLNVEDFYINRHRVIYQAILNLYDTQQNIEYVTLEDELKKFSSEDEYGGLDYLVSLPDKVPFAPSIEQYVEIVRRNSIRRKVIALTTDINQRAFDSSLEVTDLLDLFESKVFAITQGDISSETFSVRDILGNLFHNIQQWIELDSPITGIPSGFSRLDDLTAGFQRGEMIVVAARPSMGKTTLALNLARHIGVVANIPCAFFSCEMSRMQLVQNMLCAQARIDSAALRTGRMTELDSSKIATAVGQLAEAPIYIDDTPGINMRELAAKSRRLVQQHDIQMIFIDYLQLMSPPKLGRSATRENEISTLSRGMKALARELNIPVIVIAQLNRDVEKRQGPKGAGKPRMSDLRESGAIEQDADVIILLHRDYYYTKKDEDKNKATLIIAKQRNGPTGEVEIAYVLNHMFFDNLASEYESPAAFDNDYDDFEDITLPALPPPVYESQNDEIPDPYDDYDDSDNDNNLPDF